MVQMEFKVGPLTVNLRVLLEPKGVIRIIVFFVALLAFSTTAGFNSGSTSNSISCTGMGGANYSAFITFSYPYDAPSYSLRAVPDNVSNSSNCTTAMIFQTNALSTSAQFFVAMGILTMIYVVGALLVYVLFITPELFLAKWLVIGDFFVSMAFSLLYIISCIAWSVGVAQLNGSVTGKLDSYGRSCLGCTGNSGIQSLNGSIQTFLQPAVSLILGWLAAFIWASSLWFVYKDTEWHKDRTGPLASIYNVAERAKGGREGGEEGGEGGGTGGKTSE